MIETRGRLTIVTGDPDWISYDEAFTELTGDDDAHAPLYLTAFAETVATIARGGDVHEVVGSLTTDEKAALYAQSETHDRVIAFAV